MIYNECFEQLMEHYRADHTFVSAVKAEIHAEIEGNVIEKLRAELRDQVMDALKGRDASNARDSVGDKEPTYRRNLSRSAGFHY